MLRPHELEEKRSSKGMYVHLNRQGLVLLTICDKDHYTQCDPFVECITEMVMRFPSCTYAVIDVHHHPELLSKFERTDMPIGHIPFIILYYNGVPYGCYEGTPQVDELTKFIQHTLNVTRMQQHKPPTAVNNTPDDVLKGGIPNTARARKAKYAKVTDIVDTGGRD